MPCGGLLAVLAVLTASDPNPGRREAGNAADPAESPESQTGIVGRVLQFGSTDPVASARIHAIEAGESTTADAQGRFALGLPAGQHTLRITGDGVLSVNRPVIVPKVGRLELMVHLDRDLEGSRYRTVVENSREPGLTPVSLREAEMREVAGARGDPFAVVKSLAGVSQLAGFLPYVVVRGAAPGNTGYFLDGIRVPALFHAVIGASVIHPYFIDAVDFYPAGAPVRLGRAASGVIEGRTRPARRDRVAGEIDLRLTDAGALLEMPFHRPQVARCGGLRPLKVRRECRGLAQGSLTLAGRYSYTGLLLSAFPALDVELRYWDYQVRLDHDVGPRARFTSFAFGSHDSFGVKGSSSPSSDAPAPLLNYSFHRIDNRIQQRLRGGGSALWAVALGFDRSGFSDAETLVYRVAPRVVARRPLRPGLDLGFGLDQELQIFRLATSVADIEPDSVEDIGLVFNERTVSATGLWADLRLSRGILEVRPGVRVDAYVQVGHSPVLPAAKARTSAFGADPRLSTREQVGEFVALRQSVGVYHQPPDAPIPIPGIESLGFDRGLQRNVQGSFGYEVDLGEATLTQDAYLGRLSNLQDYELAAASDDPINELDDVLVRLTGWTYGLETMLKLDASARVFGWAAYTLSRSIRDHRVGGLALGSWDQTHILNVVLGYRIAQKWTLGGRVHFNTGRPYTRVVGEETLFEALRDHRNDDRLPAFFQLDLRVERIFRWPSWQLHLVLDVTNSTLSREVFQCGGSSTAVGGEEPGVARERIGSCSNPVGLRYILPSLGMRAVF